MKPFLIFLLAGCAANAQFVPQGMPVNLWLNFTTGANGSNASTAAYFHARTISDGNGTWSMNTEAQVTFTNVTEALEFPRVLTLGSLNYVDNQPSFGMRVNLSSNLSSAIWTFSAQPSQVLAAMQIKFGTINGGDNVYDIMDINNGSYALIPQYWEQKTTGHHAIFAHNANQTSSKGIWGFALNHWYWLVMYLDDRDGIGSIALIDADTGATFLDENGNASIDTINEPANASAYISIGRGDAHNDTTGGYDHGAPSVSDPLEIKNYVCATGANADVAYHYFEPLILNAATVTAGTVTHP